MRIEHVRIAAAMFLAIVLSHGVQGNDSVKRCDPFCEDSDSYTPLCTNLIVTDTCHYGNIANTLKWQRDAVKQGLDSYFKGNPVPMARAAFYMAAYARKLERVMPPPQMPIVHLYGNKRARKGGATRLVWRVIVALDSVVPSDFMGLPCGAVFHRAIHLISMMYLACP